MNEKNYNGYDIDEYMENETGYDKDAVSSLQFHADLEAASQNLFTASFDNIHNKDIIFEKTNSKKKRTKKTNIHEGHRQRVMMKFLENGLHGFSEHEVLEFLLFFAIDRRDTNPIAHELINEFGSIHNVFKAEKHDLEAVNGVGEKSSTLICLFRSIMTYLNENMQTNITLSDTTTAGMFCCNYFLQHVEESFIVLILDSKRSVKKLEVISRGTENETAFYPRKVLKAVLKHRANAVLISHNHTGNSVHPSTNDIYITNEITKLLNGINVPLVDHIICSGMNFTSLHERGLISEA